jgi:hypothetical protein
MMREIDTTHHGKLSKSEFVAILMDTYGEDALQQYDDRLYHDPEYSLSIVSPPPPSPAWHVDYSGWVIVIE